MSLIITLSREDLLSALAPLLNITGKKGTMAILSNVLLESGENSVLFTGTDLETGIRIRKPAEVSGAGSITLPTRKLFEIARESDSQHLRLEEKEKSWVRISAGSAKYNLSGMESAEYPSFPAYDDTLLVSLSSSVFQDLIDKTIFSVASEKESQFNLTGVLLEKESDSSGKSFLRMISSDGHRLSFMEKEIENEIKSEENINRFLVPKRGVQEIRRISDLYKNFFIGLEKTQLIVKTEDSLIVVRLMTGDFPDYRRLKENIKLEKDFKIKKEKLLNSLKRINLFTEDSFNSVRFVFEENKLKLSSQNADMGNANDELEIENSGEKIDLGFNGRYFIETLQVMNSETVSLFINSEESPCLISGEEDRGFISIIMPMKL